tara:strand:- start:7755 stop:9026 length:1272 start_codon:yes stop_codon:yes gene_type:complete
MSSLKVNYKQIEKNKNEIRFDIIGDNKNGLDKSIINSLRKILLTEIKTLAFDSEMIYIEKNTGSMHNEFLKDRLALIPLYLDPETFDYDFIFEINIKNKDEPIKEITTEDFIIYPIDKHTKFLANKQNDIISSGGLIPEDEDIYKKIKENPLEYFNMNQPVSDKVKDDILRPFVFDKKKYYITISELKLTNSEKDLQEIKLYCIPKKGIGLEHAKYNNISKSIYTFKIDNKLVTSECNKSIKLNNIPTKDRASYKKTFAINHSERYYFRDIINEPYIYEFTIKSNHFNDCSKLFILSIDILINNFDNFKNKLEKINKIEDYDIAKIENKKPNVYQISIKNESHNTLSILQSYFSRYYINSDSFISVLGYKQYHPLDNIMLINLIINPNDLEEIQQTNYIIESIVKVIDNITSDLNLMKTKWNL